MILDLRIFGFSIKEQTNERKDFTPTSEFLFR